MLRKLTLLLFVLSVASGCSDSSKAPASGGGGGAANNPAPIPKVQPKKNQPSP